MSEFGAALVTAAGDAAIDAELSREGSARARAALAEQAHQARALARFEADCAAAGYAGWCPVLAQGYTQHGWEPVFTRDFQGYGPGSQWLPANARRAGDALSAERMAEQFGRLDWIERAGRVSVDATLLAEPCPEKGFPRRHWLAVLDEIRAAEQENGARVAERAQEEATARAREAQRLADSPFAALAALRRQG